MAKFTDYSEKVKILRWMLGSAAVIGIIFSAFQAAGSWAAGFSILLVLVFSWAQAQRMVKAGKQRKMQTQDISIAIERAEIGELSGDGTFSIRVADTKFHENNLLALRAKLNAPFFEPVLVDLFAVSRPLDRLRVNAIEVYAGELSIGWIEIEEQSRLAELLDSVDGIARVKGKVTFGLKAESHSALIDLVIAD